MHELQTWRSVLTLLGCLALPLAAALPATADAPRAGWHGEVMPAGLERGEQEGEYVWSKDGAVMVYVPPGPFPMGSTEGDEDEQPVHQVYLDGYYIDKYEVSWGQWKLSGLPYSRSIGERRPRPEPPDWGIVDDQPVLNTSWEDARAYAEWAGKRLPTEAEWEKAARGTDGRIYPWGSEPPDFEKAVWKEHPIALTSTAPVTCCEEGASPYGALNMAGNVYEWCQDVYNPTYYAHSPEKNPVNEGPGRQRVLRGGAFVLERSDLRSAYRYRLLPVDRAPYIGFRTVVSGVPENSAREGAP
jgi:formylglycine-generating enzyme required for sulfatase activity